MAGHYWRRRIDEAFAAADFLVVLLTKNAVDSQTGVINSHWIAADIGAARYSEKVVLPVLLDEIPFPELIDDIYCIRPHDNSLQDAASSLDDAIRKHQEIARLRLPRGYEHLTQSVRTFRQEHPYETSVFVMMKFPEGLPQDQARLVDRIFEVIASALGAYDLVARRADKRQYEPDLWNNLCVYMLGSISPLLATWEPTAACHGICARDCIAAWRSRPPPPATCQRWAHPYRAHPMAARTWRYLCLLNCVQSRHRSRYDGLCSWASWYRRCPQLDHPSA